MAKFRYLGKVVRGEISDEHGNVIPDISDSIDAYGHTFHSRTYTEVEEDSIAVKGRRLDRDLGKLVAYEVTVVEKLRNNSHFEEQKAA